MATRKSSAPSQHHHYGPAVSIGSSKDAVAEARAAINDILAADVMGEVKNNALETLRSLCSVSNCSISNSIFQQGPAQEK